jgi:hypothetical protein
VIYAGKTTQGASLSMGKKRIVKGVLLIIVAVILLIVGNLFIMKTMTAMGDHLAGIESSPFNFIIAAGIFTYAGYGIGIIGLVLLIAGLFSSPPDNHKSPQ